MSESSNRGHAEITVVRDLSVFSGPLTLGKIIYHYITAYTYVA